MKAKFTFDVHPADETLEDYAFKRLPAGATAPLEEHLLVCIACQESLAALDEYILLMKLGTAELASNSRPRLLDWPRVRTKSGYAVAGVTALAIVSLGAVLSRPLRPEQRADPVQLTAFRGDDVSGMAHGRAGGTLDLAIDVSDLPGTAAFRLELVNGSGRRAWEGMAPVKDGRLSVHVPTALKYGVYWVRLYAPDGELLREFGLRAD